MAPDPSPDETLGNSLIPIVNKLQDIFTQVTVDLKLDLPQVAVVGSQSSGKSSVLEALVGRDFLPRGNDIVTRRPLILQLVKTPPAPAGLPGGASEWGEFLHAPGKMFYDFDRIRQEIQQETDRLVGSNKNVSDKPIRLKIFSPRVLTMTLVDLPGLTRIPVGDQPGDIEARIREMALEYIRRPNCIVLAVSPANVDLATSDGLQLAQVADPEGVRTIGVLTKLDIMDRGTDAAHILRNAHIPLRLGYIGLVLRSQADIQSGTPMPECRKREEAFFASRPEYRDVATHCCGVAVLARRLNAILVEHIRGLLPLLRRRIHEALEARLLELRSLGDPEPVHTRSAKGAYLLQLLCDYAERYAAMLEGRHLDLHSLTAQSALGGGGGGGGGVTQLAGGARVREVFHEHFLPALMRLDPARDLSDAEVSTVIRNGAGVAGSLLVPQEPFELLARRAIEQLLPPCLGCKERVHEELVRIAEQACPPEAARFPGLQRHLAVAVVDFIRSGAQPAEAMIRNLVECEKDYINCDHPDFIGGRGAIRAVLQERASRQAAAAQRKDSAESGPGVGQASGVPSSSGMGAGPGQRAKGALENGGRHSTPAMGLKGLPDSTPSLDDVLLPSGGRHGSNTRRRSESESDVSSMIGGGGGGSGGLTSGWFAWFLRDRPEGTGTGGGGAGGGGGHLTGGRGEDGVAVAAAAAVGSLPLPFLQRAGGGGGAGRSRLTESELAEVEVVRRLVESYFAISRKNLADLVPKSIMHHMVSYTKRGLQQQLIQELYREDLLESLLTEADDVLARRTAAKEAVAVLRAAVAALDEVPHEMTLGSVGTVAVSGAGTPTAGAAGAAAASSSSSSNAAAFSAAAAAVAAAAERGVSILPGASAGVVTVAATSGGSGTAGALTPYSGGGRTGFSSPGYQGMGGDGSRFDRRPSMAAAASLAAAATAQMQPTYMRAPEGM